MPHHFTKGTVQAAVWCKRCNKETPWRIADGRQQYCLTCYDLRRVAVAPTPEPPSESGNLFEVSQ